MFNRALRTEYLRLGIWLSLWAALGVITEAFAWSMLAGVALYLAGHLYSIFQLYRWLRNGDHSELPQGLGIWEEIYREFYRLEKKNTKRKRHLKSIVTQFEASTAALPDAAVVLDSRACIVWFNEAALTILGLRSPKDLGQRIVNLIRAPEFIQYVRAGEFDRNRDVEVPSPIAPEATLAVRVIPYGRNQHLLVARDISHIKQMESMRRDFVANASHELRTPLTVLRGYLDMMHEDAGTPMLKPWAAPLADMLQQTTRMEGIVADLLKLAQLEVGGAQTSHEEVDVALMLKEVIGDAEALSNGRHSIRADIATALNVYAQRIELQSIFSNLVANAVHYTPPEGEIIVRWWGDEQGVHFSVQDSGIGIDEKHIPRLTERFYRVDKARSRRQGGTGLGLAIVKHALERHDAWLEVASEPNVGSVFTCHFPASRVRNRQAA